MPTSRQVLHPEAFAAPRTGSATNRTGSARPAPANGVPANCTPAPLPYDAGLVQNLLDLVGPDAVPEFRARLLEDFAVADTGLEEALAAADREGLRRHSHVLISLAGAVGASGLCDLARTLTDCARALPEADLAALVTAVRAGTADLVTALPDPGLPMPGQSKR